MLRGRDRESLYARINLGIGGNHTKNDDGKSAEQPYRCRIRRAGLLPAGQLPLPGEREQDVAKDVADGARPTQKHVDFNGRLKPGQNEMGAG